MENKLVILAVPNVGLGYRDWRSHIVNHLNFQPEVLCYVFHSRHVKIWLRSNPFWPAIDPHAFILLHSRQIVVPDETAHIDPKLLPLAYTLKKRDWMHQRHAGTSVKILDHYAANMEGRGYEGEILSLLNRIKRLIKLQHSWTPKKDHGWELEHLKKNGLLEEKSRERLTVAERLKKNIGLKTKALLLDALILMCQRHGEERKADL